MIESSAEYLENGSIKARISANNAVIPDEPENVFRKEIAKWEAEGNTIVDYQAPDIPPARISKLTLVDRLNEAGLFVVALAALQADPLTYERWQASNTVDPSNAEVLALIAGIGGDASVLLASEKA